MLWFLFAITLGIAAIDWWSVQTERPSVEQIAKPLVMVGLLAAVVSSPEMASTEITTAVQLFLLGALGFGLLGDVLLLPHLDRFLHGLGAFAVGHLLLIVAFLLFATEGLPLAVGVVVSATLAGTLGRKIIAATRGSELSVPVTVYIAIITAMVLTGIGTGSAVIGVGVVLFAASDALLGWDRFVTPRPDRRVWVHVLYHLGQAMIVAGLTGLLS